MSRLRRSPTIRGILAASVMLVVFAAMIFALFKYDVDQQILARRAIVINNRVFVDQLDEETGMRGFVTTRRTEFLAPYYQGARQIGPSFNELGVLITNLGAPEAERTLLDMRSLHDEWEKTVAAPAIADRRPLIERQVRGKTLIDKFRAAGANVAGAIAKRVERIDSDTTTTIIALTIVGIASIFTFGVAVASIGRREAALELRVQRDRAVIESLQRAFSSRSEAIPRTSLGTAYLAATADAGVGGDVFDVRRIDDARGYVLVADVSGKGFAAAVDTALIKYTIAALSAHIDDPGLLLVELNRVFMGSRSEADSFVVAFLGVLDAGSLIFRYASAGHSPAFLRRDGRVETLAVTGPIIGLRDDDMCTTHAVRLHPGDLLVVATDGLTEARDERRTMLGDDGAMKWIAEIDASEPQHFVDQLVGRLRQFVGAKVSDDLAIVALAVETDAVIETDGGPEHRSQPAVGSQASLRSAHFQIRDRLRDKFRHAAGTSARQASVSEAKRRAKPTHRTHANRKYPGCQYPR